MQEAGWGLEGKGGGFNLNFLQRFTKTISVLPFFFYIFRYSFCPIA